MATANALKQRLVIMALGLLGLVALGLLVWPQVLTPPQADGCLTCHTDVADMSASHKVDALGCASCHLGNPLAGDRKNAHAGMVRNPSDLLWADKTCGRPDCHPALTNHVNHSIMSSNSGLVSSTLLQWHESSDWVDSLQQIDGGFPDSSLATSHMRKLCAGCHINKREADFPGEIGSRGGGCNDCHLQPTVEAGGHPRFTIEIGIEICAKCHNRSNRTALNYQGKFESEGYGTPFEGGNRSSDTLSGGRYFYHILPDVHFEAGMVCIDCHTMEEVMGDGRRPAHLEDQVRIRCSDCHRARFALPADSALIWKVIQMNPNLSVPADSQFAVVSRGGFLDNVYLGIKGRVLLRRKLDGRELKVTQIASRMSCNLPGHERLSCQTCHTPYTPQCYGCHDTYEPKRKQMDKITYKETPGHWSEGRSYLRFENPPLLIDQMNRVMPSAPGCQVYMTDLRDSTQKSWPTFAAFDPHITRKAALSCSGCHSSAKVLGLGSGEMRIEEGRVQVEPTYRAGLSGLGETPLEQVVTGKGKVVQRMSRFGERPFNVAEQKKIIAVSLCLVCHESYTDPIYQNFKASKKRYFNEKGLPCRRPL